VVKFAVPEPLKLLTPVIDPELEILITSCNPNEELSVVLIVFDIIFITPAVISEEAVKLVIPLIALFNEKVTVSAAETAAVI
jgi:hypothetical protein